MSISLYGRTLASVRFGGVQRTITNLRPHLAVTETQLLTIPTYDGNPQVTHPDVIYWPKSGYKWWMAFTPFPDAPRENPSILASNDGITWEAPTGLTNPVVTRAWAQTELDDPGAFNSDTDLHIGGNKLVLVWRLKGGRWYRIDSTDGITWTDPVRLQVEGVDFEPATSTSSLSPAVTTEADGTYALWAVDYSTNQIIRHTSTDGLDWSARQNCTLTPNPSSKWHVDVVRDGDTHHMLLQLTVSLSATVTYWKSTDGGLNWTGNTDPVFDSSAVDLGVADGVYGAYRSTFLVRPDGTLDIFAALRHGTSGSTVGNQLWRIALYPRVAPTS